MLRFSLVEHMHTIVLITFYLGDACTENISSKVQFLQFKMECLVLGDILSGKLMWNHLSSRTNCRKMVTEFYRVVFVLQVYTSQPLEKSKRLAKNQAKNSSTVSSAGGEKAAVVLKVSSITVDEDRCPCLGGDDLHMTSHCFNLW